MKEIKLTKQDYQNALKIWSGYCDDEPHPYSFPKYIEVYLDELEEQKLKTVLLSDTQKPVSLWRTDIENAPRINSTTILIITKIHGTYVVCPSEDLNDYFWFGSDCNVFHNNEIAYWMEILKQPEL